ncbi:MAG: hypothetical protein OEP95_11740 [Myxococcales bacterium]|nr:hypothetical protein [Myxococcales bacterium]
MRRLDRWLWGLVAALAFLIPGTPSHAGCGCDHPPPAFAPVMPPFASPGSPLLLNLETAALEEGAGYYVEFLNEKSLMPVYGKGVATSADSLRVETPSMLLTGPARIRVLREDHSVIAEFEKSLFTGLALPRRLPAGDSMILIEDFYGAVSEDGVLYIPVDLRDVQDGMQFAFVMADNPVVFGTDQVVFYNRQGVDLTLFTLAVDDPTVRQWGSYYGWDVDEDGGIVGTIYEAKVGESPAPGEQSDMLTYWRHEFHTYAAAHAPGGSHETDADGFHKDGTWHIDHDSLVIAIRGSIDGKTLKAPHLQTDLVITMVGSEGPIEPEQMAQKAYGSDVYVVENAALTSYIAGITGEETMSMDTELVSDGAEEVEEPVAIVGEPVAQSVEVAEEPAVSEPVEVAEEPVAAVAEDVDEAAPVADLWIARAAYSKKRDKLTVYAEVDGAAGAPTVSVQGFVSNAPMTWDKKKAQYVYQASSRDDLKGRLAVVSHPNAASISQVIR